MNKFDNLTNAILAALAIVAIAGVGTFATGVVIVWSSQPIAKLPFDRDMYSLGLTICQAGLYLAIIAAAITFAISKLRQ